MTADAVEIETPRTARFFKAGDHIVLKYQGLEVVFPKQPQQPKRPITHGTRGAYVNRGCRCDDCKAANSAYMKARRQRLTAEARA